MTTHRIRPATLADAGGIARLSGELGYPAPTEEVAARLAILLSLPAHFIAVAAEDDSLLGWIEIERRLTLESGARAEIVGLVVGAAHRRAGVGRALVAAAETWAAAEGLGAVAVRSNVVRAESHPFYERLGFLKHKTQHVYVRDLGPVNAAHLADRHEASG
jgi:GNAT superfamily N-acetyltransferase